MASIQQLVNRIARRARRKASTGSNMEAEILDELQVATDKFERGPTLPWFLLTRQTLLVTGAHEFVPFTGNFAGFIREWEDGNGLERFNPLADATAETFVTLKKVDDFLVIQQNFPGDAEFPGQYLIEGERFVVRGRPTGDVTYRQWFYKADPTAVAIAATTSWSTHVPDLIMGEAGMVISFSLRDSDATAFFRAIRDEARNQMIRENQARMDAHCERVMGDD